MNTKELIDRIFKEPGVKFELTEFGNLGKPIHDIITIYPKVVATGKDAGKTKFYLKSFIPFSSGNEEVQVYAEGGKSAPEEIVRQLWVYKLIQQYGYKADEIDLEKGVQFGTEVGTKAADIIVYTDVTKLTPKIIVECKKPKRKDGIEQLKSYMNAKGAPVAVWSNGADSIILYRPYPAQFDDTLFDIPKRGQAPKDVLEASKTLLQLKKDFNFKKIIQDLEELVLADSGKDEFNEIFKLIFAKIWDEKEALENRPNKVVEFRKAIDPQITYDRINNLFHKACDEWPGIFKQGEDIDLAQRHLQVCVGPIEGVRLMGSNLRIMDDAFEYLIPTEAKKKKGQFFTPRHVVEMCVRMLNPTCKGWMWCASSRDGNEQFSKGVQTMSKIVQPTEPANHIAVFQETAIRRTWHAEEWWFSIIDVVGVLSETAIPKRYWSDLKRKLAQEAGSGQPYERIVRLKLTAPDGKQRDTDCANTETLFRVIQSIPSPRAEPFKRWLAQVGYERVKEIENPELASARKSSTGAWQLASSSLAMLYRLIEVICRLQIHPKFCRSP